MKETEKIIKRSVEKKSGRNKAIDIIIRFLFVAFAIAAVYFAVQTVRYYLDGKETESEYNRLREEMAALYTPSQSEPPESGEDAVQTPDLPDVQPDTTAIKLPEFDENGFINTHHVLVNANADCVGWIKIPGTKRIDSPVVQSSDNEYYTHYSFNRRKSFHGAIFMDYRNNAEDLDDNTIIYGHNMKDGTMFAELLNYLDSKWALKHKSLLYESHYAKYSCTVFSAYIIDPEGKNVYPVRFSTDAARDAYIAEITERSAVDFGVSFDPSQKLITLSTCDYTAEGSRMIVHAVIHSVRTASSPR